MLFLRKIFFYIFLAIYLVLCPIVILYAFGFILKPDTSNPIKKTGLIHLSTVPSGASIYVNEEPRREKTPASLQELNPGNYIIKLSMDNYKNWSHDIKVSANKASVFDNILLIPSQLKSQKVINGPFDDIVPLIDTDYFILSRGRTLKDCSVYAVEADEQFPLVNEGSLYADAVVLNIYRVHSCESILLALKFKGRKRYLYIEPDRDKPVAKDVTELFTDEPDRVTWDPKNPKQIFTFQDNYINMLDITDEAVYPKYITDVAGFGLFDKKIYVLKNNYTLTCSNPDKGSPEVLLEDTRIGESLFSGKGFFRIKPVADDIILFISDKGELITNHLPYKAADSGVTGTSFYKKNRRLLVWQKSRVGILDFLTEVVEGITFEKGPELLWVDVKADNIKQAFWVLEDSHILFSDKDMASLVELEESGKPHLDDLVKIKPGTSMFYSENSGTLYYIGSSRSELLGLELVRQNPLPEEEKKNESREKEGK